MRASGTHCFSIGVPVMTPQHHQHRERRIDEAEGGDEQQHGDEPAAEDEHGNAHGAAEQIARVAWRGSGRGFERGRGGRRLDISRLKRRLAPEGG